MNLVFRISEDGSEIKLAHCFDFVATLTVVAAKVNLDDVIWGDLFPCGQYSN